MKPIIIILFFGINLLSIHFSLSQTKLTIYNTGNEALPYVNVSMKDKGIGLHANKNGEIAFDERYYENEFVFSKAGYQDTTILIDSDLKDVILKRAIIHEEEFGEIDGKRIYNLGEVHGENHGIHSNSGQPHVLLKYFSADEAAGYHIENLKFNTVSEIRNAKLLIRIYAANSNYEPGNYLYEKDIDVKVGIGEKINKVDLSNLDLRMPKHGAFIGLEALIIPENKHSFPEKNLLTDEVFQRVQYMPEYKLYKDENISSDKNPSYVFANGNYIKINRKGTAIAMELKLKRP